MLFTILNNSSLFENIQANIISDVLFLIILLLIGWLVYLITDRRNLFSFFGIINKKQLLIFYSNLQIEQGGAIGIDGEKRAYQGAAGPYEELQAAEGLSKLFKRFFPFSSQPGILKFINISAIEVQIKIARKEDINPELPTITLGSPAYNIVSADVEKKYQSTVGYFLGSKRIVEEKRLAINISPTEHSTQPVVFVANVSTQPIGTIMPLGPFPVAHPSQNIIYKSPAINITGYQPYEDVEYGFIQRIIDPGNQRSIFYIAGLCERSTAGAAYYLISNWKKLSRDFGSKKSFIVLLRFDLDNVKLNKIVIKEECK